MDKQFNKIGILDHMGSGNFGDAAAQEAFIANVKRRLPNVSIIGFSLNPDDTRIRHNIPSYSITWNYPSALDIQAQLSGVPMRKGWLKSVIKRWKPLYEIAKPIHNYIYNVTQEIGHLKQSFQIVKSLDLLVISGGGQLCDTWNGPWSHPYNIFKFAVLARLSNTPLYILNGGAGPLEHTLSKFFARWSVRLSCYTSFRDKQSQNLIRSLGVKKKTYVSPDMVYSLELEKSVPDNKSASQRPLVGLNPMSFCDPRVWPRKDSIVYCNYIDKMALLSNWLLEENYNLEIFTTAIGADRNAIDDLKEQMLLKWPEDKLSSVFPTLKTELKDVISQMARFDFVITPKFHGVIFSHLLNKPVIALRYSNKTLDLMSNVGHAKYCFDIENFDVNSLKESFNSLVKDKITLNPLFMNAVKNYSREVEKEFNDLFGQPL